MITNHISTSTKTSQLYIFNTAAEADSFYTKYSTIWILSKPFQTLSGWTITRTINN
jgi:hypothetical protein